MSTPLDNITPHRLKEVVAQLPADSRTFTEPELREILLLITDEQFLSLSESDCAQLQNLIDLTRVHLARSAEEASRSGTQGLGKVGRPARTIPSMKWKVSIRQDLGVFVDLLLLDPVRKQLKHGSRSGLIEELVLEWARKRGFKG